MEATNNTTLTTADAWRVAISLTISDVRTFVQNVIRVLKYLFIFAYGAAAFVLTLSESEDSIMLNVLGLAMITLPAMYFSNRKNVSKNED